MKFNRIHDICNYLREPRGQSCMGCPAWEPPQPGYEEFGDTQRGCYSLAKEVYNIARVGNPWGKPPNSASAKRYRVRVTKRFEKRLRKPPTLRVIK